MKIYEKNQIYKYGDGVSVRSFCKPKSVDEHLHDFIEIVYVLSGSGVHEVDGVRYTVGRGSLLFINYRQIHAFVSSGEFINVLIDPRWISEKLIDSENAFELLSLTSFHDFQSLCADKAFMRFEGSSRAWLERLLLQMIEEQEQKLPGHTTMLKAQVNILLTMVFRKMLPDAPRHDLAEYIKNHCDEKLTLESLAKKCFYNPSYFSRLFRELYGTSVTDYINRTRIEKAKQLLSTTSHTVDEIAELVGYSGRAYFYKKFAEATGLTPKQYRESKN